MEVFFSDADYRSYLGLLARKARQHSLDVWTYCLMPNHVHLIVVPASEVGLARPLGEAHHRYALHVNRQHEWTGHLWQERFASFPMDEPHLMSAVRYVLMNPVRAGLVQTPTDWPHSSARAHILGESDPLVNRVPCAERINDWELYFEAEATASAKAEALRRHGRTGRPLGSDRFVDRLEALSGRSLRPRKVGRKRRKK
jgi:putative transposase